ncbi:MAG: serine/threonine protein kinase, partial [Nostoc sp.]
EVDTSKLIANKQYKRQLILHSNAYPATHTLTVKVQTAALPIEKRKIPSGNLIGLFLMTVVVAMATTWFITYAASAVVSLLLQGFGYEWILFFGIFLLMIGSWAGYSTLKQGESVGVAVVRAVGEAVGLAVGPAVGEAVGLAVGSAVGGAVSAAVSAAVSVAVYWVMGMATDWVINLAEDSFTTVLILLTLGFGASVGTEIIASFLNPFILLALTVTSLPLFSMLLYSPLKRRRLITKYRQSEESLIKP